MRIKAILSMLLLPLLQAVGQLPDAGQILDKSRELSLARSFKATILLVITEKNGSTRSRTISMTSKSSVDGTEKRMVKFLEPADVKGTAMLVIDHKTSADEMWIYLPALRKTRRIVTTEKGKSFMSSEFSNADMSSPSTSDFINRHADKSGVGNQWIIESIPADDAKVEEYGFTRKISYVSINASHVRKIEYYNSDKELFKIIEIKSIHPLAEGRYIIKHMTAENLINKRKSEVLFSNISDGIDVEDSFFSLQNLER